MSTDEHVAANRANWDERVPVHLVGYATDAFVADAERISDVVREDVPIMAPHLPGGSVDGLRMLHLQCHIGTDSLSWVRLGADVTGIDFSPAAIAAARDLASRAGLTATFVESTVDDAADRVEGVFDVVYTSIGTITWLPDLVAWASTIAQTLAPGGLFYIRDTHPTLMTLDSERDDEQLVVTLPYFPTASPLRWDDGTTYVGEPTVFENVTTYEWPHPISEIITVLLDAGLVLESFQEHHTLPWRGLPWMVEEGDHYVLPHGADRMPLTFSLAARKPR